jgi:hypothetical protein
VWKLRLRVCGARALAQEAGGLILDFASGEPRRLAERAWADLPGPEGLVWRFDPEALDIGNALLGRVSVGVDILTAEEASTMPA